MKRLLLICFYLLFSVSCFCQTKTKSSLTIEDWKKIEEANRKEDGFDNATHRLIRQDTAFVDSVFQEKFIAIEMNWGESIDKYSFVTKNEGGQMNVKCIDIYTSSGVVFLAVVYYNENKKDFYEKHYYEKGKRIIRMISPHHMRFVERDLGQFIRIVQSIVGQ